MKTRVVKCYDMADHNYHVEKFIPEANYRDYDFMPPHVDAKWMRVYSFLELFDAEAFAEKLSKSDQEPEVVKEFG